MVQVGNQVRHRDVEKARRGDCQQVWQHPRQDIHEQYSPRRASDTGQPAKDIQRQRPASAVPGVEQHGEISDFLRHLVRGNRRGRADAKRHRGQHRGADHRAVHEVVNGASNQHQRRRDAMHFAGVGVTVSPENGLFEDEEAEDSRQQRAEDLRGGSELERLGQQRHQRDAQQCPHGITDQPRHQARALEGGQQQEQRRTQQPAKAAGKGERYCREEGRHGRHHKGRRTFVICPCDRPLSVPSRQFSAFQHGNLWHAP